MFNAKSQSLQEPFFSVESVLSLLEQESSIYWPTKTRVKTVEFASICVILAAIVDW